MGEFFMQKIRKAVIPAAGYGTRFLPATKATPKEMLPIVDKPTIQYIVEEALASGIEEILIISGHAKRAIEDHFDSAPALEMELEKKGKTELLKLVRDIGAIKIHYIRQQQMRGLGDAILCARAFVQDEPFAVLLGDDVVYNGEGRPALKQLIDVYNETGSSVLGCQTVPEEKVSSYGIIKGEPTDDARTMRVLDMVEKPAVEDAPSRMAVRSGNAWFDFIELVLHVDFLVADIDVVLEVEEIAVADAEILAEAKGRVHRDLALVPQDFLDARYRHMDVFRQPVRRDPHRLHEFFQKDF